MNMKDKNLIIAHCLKCESEFTEEQIRGFNCCPNCKTRNLPADPKNDINIKINTQELRILCMWAENYAIQTDDKNLDNPLYESLRDSVQRIVDRIRKQFPPELKKIPLTWKDEMKGIEDSGLCKSVQLFIGGKEQI